MHGKTVKFKNPQRGITDVVKQHFSKTNLTQFFVQTAN